MLHIYCFCHHKSNLMVGEEGHCPLNDVVEEKLDQKNDSLSSVKWFGHGINHNIFNCKSYLFIVCPLHHGYHCAYLRLLSSKKSSKLVPIGKPPQWWCISQRTLSKSHHWLECWWKTGSMKSWAQNQNGRWVTSCLQKNNRARKYELWTTRSLMYVPAKYVTAVLNVTGLMPRQFWDCIVPRIHTDNKIE